MNTLKATSRGAAETGRMGGPMVRIAGTAA
jgi:hypothetical protein